MGRETLNDLPGASVAADLLIVGSGPIGATFARVISERAPAATILMVEVGPQLTDRPGVHIKNIPDPQHRTAAQIRSQGPAQYQYEIPTIAERSSAVSRSGSHAQRAGFLARPGTFLAAPDGDEPGDMPAAAMSSCVGGMGAHWTCACPQPGNAERIPFISNAEWDRISARAGELLAVSQNVYPESVEAFAIKHTLGAAFNRILHENRPVQNMPLAARLREDGRLYWTGSDVVLGPLAGGTNSGFTLRSETLCRKVLVEDGRVTGAVIEHLPAGTRETVRAGAVVVAADTLRTPQLLWASGVRPRALGHYLNDQPQIMGGVELDEAIVERARQILRAKGRLHEVERQAAETIIGVFWVPYHAPQFPFHGQVMHIDASPIPMDLSETRADPRHVVGLGCFTTKEVRYDDFVEFSETETDSYGMPKMTIHYELTARDRDAIAKARQWQARAADAFGKTIKDEESRLLPAGSSLHYQGTVRMGERDDGTSVCDPYSQVWGVHNLYVGGNGVIPTATASNPTLTSAALAVRAAEKLAADLVRHSE